MPNSNALLVRKVLSFRWNFTCSRCNPAHSCATQIWVIAENIPHAALARGVNQFGHLTEAHSQLTNFGERGVMAYSDSHEPARMPFLLVLAFHQIIAAQVILVVVTIHIKALILSCYLGHERSCSGSGHLFNLQDSATSLGVPSGTIYELSMTCASTGSPWSIRELYSGATYCSPSP
jgi:hypothetical protein